MAHNKELIENVNPRGAVGGTPEAAARETPAERTLRLEREGQEQLAREAAERQGGGGGTPPLHGNLQGAASAQFWASRLFRMPNGDWITPRNMAATYAIQFRGRGYRGPWFPQRQDQLVAFMKSDKYIKLYRELTAFLAGGGPGPNAGQEIPFDLPGAGGGLGGFGSVGPVYQAPDEEAVREALQGFQVAVTGQLDDPLLDGAVAEYLNVHKQDFDDKNAQHDPFQAAKRIIRGSESYKDIHKLRKTSENELAWVTTQQGRLRTLGLTSAQSEQLGIKLARVGANQEAAQDAGETAFFKSTGRVAKDQRDSLKASARSVLGLL